MNILAYNTYYISMVFGTFAWLVLTKKAFLLKQSWLKMILEQWEEPRRPSGKVCLVQSPEELWWNRGPRGAHSLVQKEWCLFTGVM